MKQELYNRFRKAVIQELESQHQAVGCELRIDFMDAREVVINEMVKAAPEHQKEELVAVLSPLRWEDLYVDLPLQFVCADDDL